jgi:methyltransferase-like protein 6
MADRECNHISASTNNTGGDNNRDINKKISEFWHRKYRQDLGKNWNLFYKRNETRFFRDRHWIPQEFPELLDTTRKIRLFEVGCGVGNFTFPLAEINGELEVVGCDISARAIELFQENEAYASGRFNVFVADIIKDDLSERVGEESVDIATSIFVLSALPPETLPKVIKNVCKTMKPGGSWFIRDYSSSDAAQHRFDADKSRLERGLFVRQDGTLAHYFDPGELTELMMELFEVAESKEVKSRTSNMKTGLDLERSFIQLKLIKKH